MPITWRNVAAPESYSGSQLMNQGANRIGQGLSQLTNFAQQEQQNLVNRERTQEQEQAQAFEQQLMGMGDDEVMVLQEQFQANPQAAQEQFGGQAENVFNVLQQEPVRREEEANAAFQREQATMARTTAPVLDRGRNEIAAFNMNPSDPENKKALNATIQELEDMGAQGQAAEMRQMQLAAMDENQLEQRNENLRGMRTEVNNLQQRVMQGDMSQGDFLDNYDKLVDQYGEDVVSEVMPYNTYNQLGLESAQQAGQISEAQQAQIQGFNENVEYYRTRLNEEFEADLADIERLSPDNYYASLNDEARQQEDTGATTQNWETQLQGQGISEGNAREYSSFAQEEAQRIFNETVKEKTGLTKLPGAMVQRALNKVSLDTRWIDSLGTQDDNKARITTALAQEANNYINAEKMTQRKREAEEEHRRTLQALREETKTVNGKLSRHVSGDMNREITPDVLNEAVRDTEVMSRVLGQQRNEEQAAGAEPAQEPQQPQPGEPDELELMLRAQEAGNATPEMEQEIAQRLGLDLPTQAAGTQQDEAALWDNQNRSFLQNVDSVGNALFNTIGPGPLINAAGNVRDELQDQGTLLNRNLTTTGAQREQQLTDYRDWVTRTGNLDVSFAEWLRSQ